ncbi:hypothetical protein [Riemerella anatipestifer]|uniref:Transcriptional regulator n=1 Tax=Riemerella anatipestifer TaxID=34085 RepID=A0AAP3EWF6_RIEAN|nr:hypothetical protein [Riemerella anatipestifer]NHW58376.1 hypothetical protein [Escherichia coli]MBT0552607.1 hypothetical protein [Riemerella anatipestifer]MBT0554909.1 hypothetical protein [Riemerella anatipestifer]MBT0574300.1 hypothetical protein [Riemerella anatipestifer]MCO7319836.1 hypothetical protein [Riemerella anatipestifer]
MEKKDNTFKIGDLVMVSPDLTLLNDWIVGKVIKIRNNPFVGIEIAIEDDKGRIFFGEKNYFKLQKENDLCTR